MYHDKIGILEDVEKNKVLFIGSPNESLSAYVHNYEKIRVSVSWNKGDIPRIEDDEREFEGIWNGANKYVHHIDYTYIIMEN